MLILLLIVAMLLSIKSVSGQNTDLKLIIMGVVIHQDSYQPLEGVKVKMIDAETDEAQYYKTDADGSFYFSVTNNNKYLLLVRDENSNVADMINVSTHKMDQPQIINVVLSLNREVDNLLTPETSTFEVIPSKQYCCPTLE